MDCCDQSLKPASRRSLPGPSNVEVAMNQQRTIIMDETSKGWVVSKLCDIPCRANCITLDDKNVYYGERGSCVWKVSKYQRYKPQLLFNSPGSYFTKIFLHNSILYLKDMMQNDYEFDIQTEEGFEMESTALNPDFIDNHGNFYLISEWNEVVQKTTQISQPKRLGNALYWKDITVSKDGTVYGCSLSCIEKLEYGTSKIAAGSKTPLYQDGHLTSARFEKPHNLREDVDGTFLLCEGISCFCLRRLDFKNNMVTTVPIEGLKDITCFATDHKTQDLYVAADKAIYRVNRAWRMERLLWIVFSKESTQYCYLAKLPRDLIRLVIKFLRQR